MKVNLRWWLEKCTCCLGAKITWEVVCRPVCSERPSTRICGVCLYCGVPLHLWNGSWRNSKKIASSEKCIGWTIWLQIDGGDMSCLGVILHHHLRIQPVSEPKPHVQDWHDTRRHDCDDADDHQCWFLMVKMTMTMMMMMMMEPSEICSLPLLQLSIEDLVWEGKAVGDIKNNLVCRHLTN